MNIEMQNAGVPNAIARIIEEKGMKQYVVAERSGMTAQMLTDIFAGRRLIKARDIVMIARALEVMPNELFPEAPTRTA